MAEFETYFREVRSLLHGEPNEHNFKKLCKLLENALKDERERAVSELVPYAEGMMRLWPHRLRRMPPAWLNYIEKRAPLHVSALQPLMRTILISNRAISARELSALLDSEFFKPIMRLELQGLHQEWYSWTRSETEAKLGAILDNAHFSNLEELDFTRFINSVGCYKILAESDKMSGVRVLSLRRSFRYGLKQLASSEHLANIQELDLSYIPCGSATDSDALRSYIFEQTSKMVSIERLYLRDSNVNNDDLEALARSPFVKKLTHIDLRDNKHITTKGLRALLRACGPQQLRSLELSNTRIGGGGLKLLATSHALTDLKLLRIYNVGETEAGVKAMANSETLPREFTEPFRAEGDEEEGDDDDA
jgi:hypothetical protein